MSTIFVTMVYNDPVFLDIWVRYYEKHTDRKNLHIITHGPDETYAYEIGAGCTFVECPRDPLNPRLDQDRFVFISDYCSELTKTHTRVIHNDVDEIIVLDPAFNGNLVDYIEGIDPAIRVITPLGLELVHRKDRENDYDYSRALFAQRKYVRVNGWYTKPCITNTEIIWGPDGHGCSHDTLYLDDNLYLFHLKWFDDQFHINRHKDRLKLRFKDEDGVEVIVGAGSWSWSEMTYQLATNMFLRHGDDKFGSGMEFAYYRDRVTSSFQVSSQSDDMYKINWFVDQNFRVLPDSFVGLI